MASNETHGLDIDFSRPAKGNGTFDFNNEGDDIEIKNWRWSLTGLY